MSTIKTMAIRPTHGAIITMLALLFVPLLAWADGGANFDLDGPSLYVQVTRGDKTLEISQVPNLLGGDKLWIQPAFPEGQSAKYLLIVCFLRGSTNPPPDEWFYKLETWNAEARAKGMSLTVPDGAEQALLLLAPVTGGDFNTLRKAVRDKPGAFVRAVQDLQQASLQRSRLQTYLTSVQKIASTAPQDLRKEAPLLARSLRIKLEPDCFEKPADQQAECLTQNSSNLVMDDGNTQNMVSQLTNGVNTDLVGQLSATRFAGGGAYSPYVGAVVDMVRIFGSLHTAKYQYIPAISMYSGEQINLKLNNPPSFRDPKSVLVVGLPPVGNAHLPVLMASDPDRTTCLQDTHFVLPVEGAPLLFSTNYGRDLKLELKDQSGKPIELPVTGDPTRGGLILKDTSTLPPGLNGEAKLSGNWGFDSFNGPRFRILSASGPAQWTLKPEENERLMIGQVNTVHLLSAQAACSEKITLAADPSKSLTWKPEKDKTDAIELQLPLQETKAGDVLVSIKQFGVPQPEVVTLRAYSNDVKLASFRYHAGDSSLLLTGAHLEQLSSLKLQGVKFIPNAELSSGSEVTLVAQGDASALKALGTQIAKAVLRDGRTVDVNGQVEGPRPQVTLLSKEVTQATSATPTVILRLGSPNDLPVNGTLTFFLKCDPKFKRTMKIEVATTDESATMSLTFADGTMVLQDESTARAELNPAKSFGPSVFGDLRFRVVDPQGGNGDWQPLARLVRLPKITQIVCPEELGKPCRLEGSDLFLISAISATQSFKEPVTVAEGFAGSSINVPRPNGTLLYLKLRDAPGTINRLLAPVFPDSLAVAAK
jgi:hypothetical protein